MVAEIGLEREEPKAWRILMLSFRLKLKLLVYKIQHRSDGYRDVWARNDFVSWIVKQFSM